MKRAIPLLLSAAVMLTLATGCGAKQNTASNYKAQSREQHVLQTNRPASNSTHATSDKLAKEIATIKGVDKATVVIHNNDAIVGLDVKKGGNMAAIQDEAVKKVKTQSASYNVHVTTDKNLHMRVQSLRDGMKPLDGHPVRNFSQDVYTLIRDIGHTVTAPVRK